MIYTTPLGVIYMDRGTFPQVLAATCHKCGRAKIPTGQQHVIAAAESLRADGWKETGRGWECPVCLKAGKR